RPRVSQGSQLRVASPPPVERRAKPPRPAEPLTTVKGQPGAASGSLLRGRSRMARRPPKAMIGRECSPRGTTAVQHLYLGLVIAAFGAFAVTLLGASFWAR